VATFKAVATDQVIRDPGGAGRTAGSTERWRRRCTPVACRKRRRMRARRAVGRQAQKKGKTVKSPTLYLARGDCVTS